MQDVEDADGSLVLYYAKTYKTLLPLLLKAFRRGTVNLREANALFTDNTV